MLNTIVDGKRAAVNWDETGSTKRVDAWAAIGCDVYRVVNGKIVELTVYGDTEKMTRHLLQTVNFICPSGLPRIE